MSEFQYHEFRTVDRSLAPAEQKAVAALSSRVSPHPTRAVFTYNYSSFPDDPLSVLRDFYDAYFYMANWGTVRLAFRLPGDLLDLERFHSHYVEYSVELHQDDPSEDAILVLSREREDYEDWIDPEGTLDALLPLREELLGGDWRLLYVAWLSALEGWQVDEEQIEPPVPPGLLDPSPALQAFLELFRVDPHLVEAAAQASPARPRVNARDLEQAIASLTQAEQRSWLLRLATGEPYLAATFRRHVLPSVEELVPGSRTVSELEIAARRLRKAHRQQRAAEAEAQRIRDLEALAPKAEDIWIFANQLIEGGANSYDEAVDLLIKLRDLAVHQGTTLQYAARIQALREKYPRRPALLKKLERAEPPGA